ncbi:BTAD domain-containing putative transcriptional regulator (plasmid) [Streptomyces rochei]|uniref:BTAD domain-containing putative transcriptional regulator n=1 Tax=Streptomyces rochei TaxID=1928 RepID=A0ABW7E8F7_STRRO|nr:BTAD domain-containing putative transcriptional regulator [Streptomyces rochei]WMI61953.1 BTAD domain-containing putative transcriptional regulator [Streptomyces rochei]
MEVRLLGPVEVISDDGSRLPLTASMPRTVLAALALRPGETVLADTVIDQIWGENAPRTARATLRSHVMRLRKILPEQRLHTGSGGYRLAVRPEETDLGRLRDLLRQARERTGEDPAGALAMLEQGSVLWRGSPLSGVADSPLLATEKPRLEELRLAAAEERFALCLSLGHHFTVLDEISEASAAFPLREGFAAQLMQALHAWGRTAEALAVYRQTRRRLIDELGIEPGAELRRVEKLILTGGGKGWEGTGEGGRVPIVGEPRARAGRETGKADVTGPLPEQGTTQDPEGDEREDQEPDTPGDPAEQRDGTAASPVDHVGHRDPTDPERNAPVPLASPARRMRTILSGLITATAAAIGSALGVMLTLVVGPEPSRSTEAPTAAATPARGAPSCSGFECVGKDPERLGCHVGVWTAAAVEHGQLLVELRYSPTCRAAWSRITGAGVGDVARVEEVRGESQERTLNYDQDTYSPMVEAPYPAAARACAHLKNGQKVCTERGGPSPLPEARTDESHRS